MVIALLCLALVACVSAENTCVNDFKLYATKTSYETVRYQEQIPAPTCTPKTLWFLSRHGTRYNRIKDQEEILTTVQNDILANAASGSLCESSVDRIRTWTMRMQVEDDMKLAETGWQELRGIGSRIKARYPSLFAQYDPERYLVRHTNYSGGGDRTRDTARAWAQGVFDTYEGVRMIESGEPDYLLHFYKFCDKYDQVVGDNDVEEREKFLVGPEMAEALKDTAILLGLGENYFNYDLLNEVYEMCRVERGIYGDSPWCDILTPDVLRVIEFAEDIKYYWGDSYAHQINYEIACTPLADLMQTLRNAANNNGKLAVAAFGHSQTMNSFFARLGLFYDGEDLTADGFIRQVDRNFRTSLHTSMASNIYFVLSSCESGLVVETFVNDAPTVVPGCDGLQCPLEAFELLWGPIADTCDIEEICRVEDDFQSSSVTNLPSIFILFTTMLFCFTKR